MSSPSAGELRDALTAFIAASATRDSGQIGAALNRVLELEAQLPADAPERLVPRHRGLRRDKSVQQRRLPSQRTNHRLSYRRHHRMSARSFRPRLRSRRVRCLPRAALQN